MTQKQEWFKEWFDTKYYHILYQDRNDDEAQLFMRNLLSFLQLKKNSKILDLPCGRGRHAVFLNSLGFNVIGADLSENSIKYASQFTNDTLRFEVQDMRNKFVTKFDAIFNLFTSFGYFDDDKTNIKVLQNLKDGLKSNGVLVIDFMNVNYVKQHFVKEESITKNNIEFLITRSVTNHFIVKDIRFTADGKEHHFTERVKYLPITTLKDYLKKANLKLKHTFGEYSLSDFDSENSSRLILILE
ncbi:MAG: methyltransferase domain-containing protein [Flavobacteriaceae bacterium]|nr:methyltransferase domain-containing protein [Flavobacteriaceae bacterium]